MSSNKFVNLTHRLSVGNRIYLLSSFNNINYFPRESIETVLKSIRPFISNLSDDQSFSVLCTLLKTKWDSMFLFIAD